MDPINLSVIGDPISHSRSPAIHSAALAALGLTGTYTARQVRSGELEALMGEIRTGSLDGVNVTMPHKTAVAGLCDRLDPDASASLSVNTVVRREGELVGFSTDVSGLRRLWRTMPPDRPVLVLGNGGAAAAACLAAQGRTLYVSARRSEAAAELVGRIDRPAVVIPWGTAVVEAIVVNATPLGMKGEPLADRVVELASGLVDMAYGPDETPAVARAKEMKIPVSDGIDVLVAQAADSFKLWTGLEPPISVMESAARNRSSEGSSTPN